MKIFRLVYNETGRLIRNKRFWLLAGAMLLLNIAVLFRYDAKSEVVPNDYKQLKKQILHLEVSKQLQVLEELAEQDKRMLLLDELAEQDKQMLLLDGLAEQDELMLLLENNGYSMPNSAAMQLLEELYMTMDYQAYLEKIQTEFKRNQDISIFAQSRFAINNSKKTAKDYQPLDGISLSLLGGYGLSRVLSVHVSTLCIIFLLALLVMYSILEEKKSGVLELYQSAPYGRAELCLSKIISIFLLSGLLNSLFFIENVAYAIYAYGGIDFTENIQALYGYNQCILQITVGQFLVMYFLFSWFGFLFVGLLMMVFASLVQNEIFYYAILGLVFLVELLIYGISYHIGKLSFFQYFNIAYLLRTEGFFTYYNYDFFGQAFHMPETNLAGMVFLCVIFSLLCVSFFEKYSCNYRALSVKQIFAGKRFSHTVWNQERYKIFYGNKVAVFIVLLSLFQLAGYSGRSAKQYIDEMYFKYYVKQIEGAVTEEKLEYMKGERQRLDALDAEFLSYEEQLESGEITEAVYDRRMSQILPELNKIPGFEMAENYVKYIMELKCENKGLVYYGGWRYLAGSGDFKTDIENGILLVISLILVLSAVFAQEYQYRMHTLVFISGERNRSIFCRLGISAIISTLIFALVYVPEWLWVYTEYGLNGSVWDVHSIPFLGAFPIECTVAGYYVIVYMVRYLVTLFIGGCIVFLGRILKNTNLTIIISAILFLLPLILHMMGMHFVDSCSLNKWISGNMLFLEHI